jgi:hypothetical protein
MLHSAFRFTLALLLVTTACGDKDANENCDGMTAGIEQDVCVGKRLKETPGADIERAIELAKKIRDPMVKGEAVSTWVETHANEIPMEKGNTLCSMLEGRDGAYCQRRLSSPHLK